jgi:hypothetical protein
MARAGAMEGNVYHVRTFLSCYARLSVTNPAKRTTPTKKPLRATSRTRRAHFSVRLSLELLVPLMRVFSTTKESLCMSERAP